MKRFILILVLASTCFGLEARNMDVTLQVVDGYGRMLSGVKVEVASSDVELYTGSNGSVAFSAEEGTEVVVSIFNGYRRTVAVDSENMVVVLDGDSRLLGTGYSSAVTKRTSSAAVAGIGCEDFGNSKRTQILNALYGMVPGLEIYQRGSGPNPSDTHPGINIRGAGSYKGNNVLVLVDGVPRDASYLDVGEVESVSVLKDAASLALYGIRGADGAVLITTKRGGDNRFSIKAGYSFGVQMPARMPEMASPAAYASAINEARTNDGLVPYYSASDIAGLANGTQTLIPVADWKDMILRKAGFENDVNMSINGSSKAVRYFVYTDYRSSRGFFNNTGLLDNLSTQNAYDALKIRTNLDIVITRSTNVEVNLASRIQQHSGPVNGTSLSGMYGTPAIGFPVKYDDTWARSTLFSNPVQDILATGTKSSFSRMLSADMTIRQDLAMILKGLKAEVKIAYDNSADITDNKSFSYSYYTFSPLYDDAGTLSDYDVRKYGNDTGMSFYSGLSSQFMHLSTWAKLGWDRSFGRHHAGAAFVFNRDRRAYTGANNTYLHHDYILTSHYDYAGKYIVDFTGSYSGSSLMPSGDKFRFYPAVSAAWVISEEDFMKHSDAVDYLKLRGSYGMTGMDCRLSYDMDVQFNGPGRGYMFVTPSVISGQKEGALPATDVEPELDRKASLGVEFTLLKGLSGSIDGFYNKRSNIRTSATDMLSGVLGIGAADSFEGETTNHGMEVSLGWRQKISDFTYNISGSFSWNRNKITKVNEIYHPSGYMYLQGNRIGQFYGLVSDGLYKESDFTPSGELLPELPENTFSHVQPGDVKYKDLNGDNRIDSYDYTYQLKSDKPEIYYGFRIGFDWKGLGIDARFQGAASYTIKTTLPGVYHPLYGGTRNISEHYLENYCEAGGKYPRLSTLDDKNNFLASDLWTEEGGFFKLREVELHYVLPHRITDRWKLGEIRFHVRGNDLFSLDRIKILDPEAMNLGYPVSKGISGGFRVTF